MPRPGAVVSVAPVMPRHVAPDCADPFELARFWSGVTGWPVSDEDQPGDDEGW